MCIYISFLEKNILSFLNQSYSLLHNFQIVIKRFKKHVFTKINEVFVLITIVIIVCSQTFFGIKETVQESYPYHYPLVDSQLVPALARKSNSLNSQIKYENLNTVYPVKNVENYICNFNDKVNRVKSAFDLI